jgi:hypothetical protein
LRYSRHGQDGFKIGISKKSLIERETFFPDSCLGGDSRDLVIYSVTKSKPK